jgi:hypothetical protein
LVTQIMISSFDKGGSSGNGGSDDGSDKGDSAQDDHDTLDDHDILDGQAHDLAVQFPMVEFAEYFVDS